MKYEDRQIAGIHYNQLQKNEINETLEISAILKQTYCAKFKTCAETKTCIIKELWYNIREIKKGAHESGLRVSCYALTFNLI